jgi:hypothetical protein
MKYATLFITTLAAATVARAEEAIPKRPDFNRYAAMIERSPFVIATAPAPVDTTPSWSKDLFIANAAHTPEADLLTISSMADRGMKEYLSTEGPNAKGYSISSIEWSDKPGATKANICKDGQCATIGFNEALVFQPPAPAAQPMARPMPMPQVPPAGMPAPHVRGVIQRIPQKLPPEQQKEIEQKEAAAKAQEAEAAAAAAGVVPPQQ